MTVGYPTKKIASANENTETYIFYDEDKVKYNVRLHTLSSSLSSNLFVAFATQNNTKITGTAVSSIKVFATVANLIRDVYSRHQGYTIQFEAWIGEGSRVKLYDALARRLAREINGVVETVVKSHDKVYRISPR